MVDRVKRGDGRPSRRAVCGLLVAAPLTLVRARAAEEGASAWDASEHARVRLIDAGVLPRDSHKRLAGIEIELDPQYLTYWRSPGEAGVPPVASFEGSTNLRSATLLYPAPGRFSEDGSEAIGYKNSVVFPVEIEAAEAGKPVTLALDLAYATCERLCVPARARGTLRLGSPEDSEGDGVARVREALGRVPARAAVGEGGPISVVAVKGDAAQPTVTVIAKAAGMDVPLLFAEAPDPWFVQAGAGLWTNDGSLKYTVSVLSRPPDPAPLPLRLTLVGTDGAIDVPLQLDPPAPKP